MKKIIILLVVLVSMSTYAQPGRQNSNKRFAQNFTSVQNATLKSKKMALHLDLSTQQQNKIYALILKQEQKREKFRKNNQAKRNSNLKIIATERFNMTNKGIDAKIAFQSELKNILNPKQYGIWKKYAKKNDVSRFRKSGTHRQKGRF